MQEQNRIDYMQILECVLRSGICIFGCIEITAGFLVGKYSQKDSMNKKVSNVVFKKLLQ